MERSASADRRAQRQRRQQLLEAARNTYPILSYQEKGALVDALVELSGFHRKSVLTLVTIQLRFAVAADMAPRWFSCWKRSGRPVTISAANVWRRYCPH